MSIKKPQDMYQYGPSKLTRSLLATLRSVLRLKMARLQQYLYLPRYLLTVLTYQLPLRASGHDEASRRPGQQVRRP